MLENMLQCDNWYWYGTLTLVCGLSTVNLYTRCIKCNNHHMAHVMIVTFDMGQCTVFI